MDNPGQQGPSREGNFSPTNPFNDLGNQRSAYPATSGGYGQQHPPPVSGQPTDDMANAAARLANLQLSAQPLSSSPAPAQQAQFGPGYGGQMTAAPVPQAMTQVMSPSATIQTPQGAPAQMQGTFAPGYGPPQPVQPMSPPQQQQQQHQYQQQSPHRQAQQDMYQPTSGGPSMDGGAQQAQRLMPPPLLGPMLQFVNVDLERAVWQGSVLLLTNESLLPHGARPAPAPQGGSGYSGSPMHGGPTPSTPVSGHVPVVEVWDDGIHGPGTGKPKTFTAKPLHTEPTFNYTFWRTDIELPLPHEEEVDVQYQVYWGADETAVQSHSARQSYTFRLPAQATQWRMCVTSDNQFSRRVPEASRVTLRGSGPVFRDLLAKHRTKPFHVWLGTGGQFNGEGVWDDCENVLRPFLLGGLDNLRRSRVVWTTDMAAAVERWYLLEYLRQWFGAGMSTAMETEGQECFRQAVTTIPYSFTPDTEIFPGFGSYIPLLQSSPVFMGIKSIATKYYALFQGHTMLSLAHNEHGYLAEGFHSIKRLGPYTSILTLDTRTERQLSGIIQRRSYDMLFSELEARVPATTTNLVVVSSNPVIFPRTKNCESFLRGASNSGITSIISYAVNGKQARNDWIAKDRFGESMAVTKLNDFWTCGSHKSERSFVVHTLQEFSRRRSCRVTFASGHVNCLSAAHFRTYTDSKHDPRRYPEQRGFVSDFRSMIQLTVSGLVQEPADGFTLRAYHFAGKSAPFDIYTEEKLYHTFNMDVNRLPPPNNNHKLLGRRSYGIIVEHDFDNDRQHPGLLSFFYVENETCSGTVTPYIINIPPLKYPHLPAAGTQYQPQGDGRPQMQQAVTYRSYTGGGEAAAPLAAGGAMAAAADAHRQQHLPPPGEKSGEDPYTYDVPGYENQVAGDGSQGTSQKQVPPPPPYSPLQQQQQAQQQQQQQPPHVMPARTEGTYSSSYEHTAAWVQGNGGSHTTESDAGGPTHQQHQPYMQPLSAHQQPTYTQQHQPEYSQPAQQQVYSQPPQQQVYSQPPQQQVYSQPTQQAQQPLQQQQQQQQQAYGHPYVAQQALSSPQPPASSSHATPQPQQQQQPPPSQQQQPPPPPQQ